jgi:hypothetical protein
VRRTLGRVVVSMATTLLLLGGGTAFAAQPASLENVADSDRGASAAGTAMTETGAPANLGPHCHFVLPADGKSPFDRIRTGAAHQGHVQTGLADGIFEATGCD